MPGVVDIKSHDSELGHDIMDEIDWTEALVFLFHERTSEVSSSQLSLESDEVLHNPTRRPAGNEDPSSKVSPLLRLPEEVLLNVCRGLRCADLVRLGWVCRRLRALCRSPRAWSHAVFPGCDSFIREQCRPRLGARGVLLIAPALHTVVVAGRWPAVNLLDCTRNVKVFEYQSRGLRGCEQDGDRLFDLLSHYRHHLQKVKLECLHDSRFLRLIDTMEKMQELYLSSSQSQRAPDQRLVKVYPGCSKTVTSLKLAVNVNSDVAAHLVKVNRDSLTSFVVHSATISHNAWAKGSLNTPFYRELRLCAALQELAIPAKGNLAILDSFPLLRTLTLFDFGGEDHAVVKRIWEETRVVRKLHSLSLDMHCTSHRGLLQVVATACTSLRELRVLYRPSLFYPGPVVLPWDLHVVIGGMTSLTKLTFVQARVISTFIGAVAEGALPDLAELNMFACKVSKDGLANLKKLKSRRQDLKVKTRELKLHDEDDYHEEDMGADWFRFCDEEMCQIPDPFESEEEL